ncbi:MAG TPA: AMP-binding protein, partial [Phycisphaerae bacterium]|nr:AMP-binding protein [Phycisphaerae bacterium]
MSSSAAGPSKQPAVQMHPPPTAFAAEAHVKSIEEYEAEYRHSIENPDEYWSEIAAGNHFFKKWDRVVQWNPPFAKWFVNAETNISYNCLDYQIEQGRGDHPAIIWEGEPVSADGTPKEIRRLTYWELLVEVCRFANALTKLGVEKGDRVTIYMPMVPELAIAMLACARIGAPHSVIFGGFSGQAIADRVQDADSHVIVTADGGYRRGAIVPLKQNVDEACKLTDLIEQVIVFRRTGERVNWVEGRDIWWSDAIAGASDACEAERLDAEHMLYLLYTSGSTGKPKGILHTTAGYMVFTRHTAKVVFDLKPDDVYWCTADPGWVTGHSYIVYGPLIAGATGVFYEG